jgi:hypothetical protein
MGTQSRRCGRLLGPAQPKPSKLIPERVISTLDSRDGPAPTFAFLLDVDTEVLLFGEAFICVTLSSDGAAKRFELRGRDRPSFWPLDANPGETPTSANTNIP